MFLFYPAKYYIKPFSIFGKLWFVGNADVGSYLIDSGKGLILIDTTYPTTRDLLIQAIWEAGFNPRDIKYILHTHGHYDHFGTTAFLKDLSGAKTVLGVEDARMFKERPELALIQDGYLKKMPLFSPDIELEDGDIISLGNIDIKAVSVPGHTMGTMAYFFELEENGEKQLAGLFGGIGFNTLTKEFSEKYQVPEYRINFIRSLEKVKDVPVSITLGNHTEQAHMLEKRDKMLQSKDNNPFIDILEWRAFITNTKNDYLAMLEKE